MAQWVNVCCTNLKTWLQSLEPKAEGEHCLKVALSVSTMACA